MEQKYVEPQIDIISFEECDVVRTSGEQGGVTPNPNPGDSYTDTW